MVRWAGFGALRTSLVDGVRRYQRRRAVRECEYRCPELRNFIIDRLDARKSRTQARKFPLQRFDLALPCLEDGALLQHDLIQSLNCSQGGAGKVAGCDALVVGTQVECFMKILRSRSERAGIWISALEIPSRNWHRGDSPQHVLSVDRNEVFLRVA